MLDPNAAIALSAALFGLGILGVFVRRNPIAVLLSLQLMLAASVLALVSFDLTFAGSSAGQGFGVLILSVATAQVSVGLGLLIAARRKSGERAEGNSQC
jgi:NADH-quinone oxidoreductase subunit K